MRKSVPRCDVMKSSTNISKQNAASIFSWDKQERSVFYTTSGRNDSNLGTELDNWMSGYKKGLSLSMKPKVKETFPFEHREGVLGEWRYNSTHS
jgi:hypothetical protein